MGFFEIMVITAATVAGVTILLMIIGAVGRKSLRDKAINWMAENGFTDYRIAFTPGDAVAVDYLTNRIAIQVNDKQKIFSFDQIVSVEICEDGVSITKTNRGGQAVGAAIGAIAFGPLGAVVGGLSGSTASKQKVSKASINIITKDTEIPFIEIKVYHDQPIDKDRLIYRHLSKDLMEWYGRLRAIVEAS